MSTGDYYAVEFINTVLSDFANHFGNAKGARSAVEVWWLGLKASDGFTV